MPEWMTFPNIMVFLATLALFIPLRTAAMNYRRSVHEELDKNFRNVVKELSSPNVEERLAAATIMGTFIEKGILSKGKYYDEAVDILIAKVYVELDYNVLNVIKGSLQKVGEEEYAKIVEKLLDMDRNFFAQEDVLKKWSKDAEKEFQTIEERWIEREKLFKEIHSEFDRVKMEFDNLKKEESRRKWEILYAKEKTFKELDLHKRVSADFISRFLEVTKRSPIKGLKFYLNSLNYAAMRSLNLSNAEFESSALSVSRIIETMFNGSTIKDTVFTFSDLTKSNFVNCEITTSLFDQTSLRGASFFKSKFEDVFFAGSDLTGATFEGAQGLQPIYFYKAKIDKANFDVEFKETLDSELPKINEEEFKNYIKNNSKLSKQRIEELFKTLKIGAEEETRGD